MVAAPIAAFSWKERKQLGLDSSAYNELLRKKQPVYEFAKEFDLTGWENVTGKEFKISRVSTPEEELQQWKEARKKVKVRYRAFCG